MPIKPDPNKRYALASCGCFVHGDLHNGVVLNLNNCDNVMDNIAIEAQDRGIERFVKVDAFIAVPKDSDDCTLVFVPIPDELYHLFPDIDPPTDEELYDRSIRWAAEQSKRGI